MHSANMTMTSDVGQTGYYFDTTPLDSWENHWDLADRFDVRVTPISDTASGYRAEGTYQDIAVFLQVLHGLPEAVVHERLSTHFMEIL